MRFSLRSTSLLLALALPLACSQTSDTKADEGDAAPREDGSSPDDRPPLFNPDPSPPAPSQLVPALDGPSVGMQPGYLDGAFLFASATAGTLQEFGQSIPLSPSDARDLAEVGVVLGADPRVDDVLTHLGIDPTARTSLSMRPIVDHAAAVKQTIDQGGPLFDELNRPDEGKPDAPAAVPLSADAELFLDRAETLGVHVRWHLPMKDPARSKPLIETIQNRPFNEWATTCATIGPALACSGGSDAVFVLRELPGALQIDGLIFFKSAHAEADTELRRALVQQAVALPAAQSIPGVGSLRGDANLLVAGTPFVNAMRASEMTRVASQIRWDGREALTRYAKRDEAIRSMHDVDRLFDGIKIEAKISPQRLHANFAWLTTPLGKQKIAEMFQLLQVDADVPSLAALCNGSLACARSRGVPTTGNFASLATGPFADPTLFEDLLDHADEEQVMLLLLLESWPNLIGAASKAPGKMMQPPDSVIVENARKASERVLAFGGAVRKLTMVNEQVSAEWVGFARMPEKDLSTLRGLLRMGELGLQPVTLEGVPGSIESAALPDDDLPGRFYSISDPEIATGAWGWAVIADGDERVRWMAGLPRDDGAAPIAYVEIADLWRLIAGVDELTREFGYAQAWLSGRSLRAQWTHTPEGPQVRAMFEKRP